MTRLFPIVRFADDETAVSYVSRLARLHRSDAATFCAELGMRLSGVETGKRADIELLADLTGTAFERITHSSPVHLDDGNYRLGASIFPKTALRRGRIFVCPRCLASDLASSADPVEGVAAYGRAIWCIAAIRTCHIHDVRLMEVPAAARLRNDFAAAIASQRPQIMAAAQSAECVEASSLERYAARRLSNPSAVDEMQEFDLYSLIKFCELAGALSIKGSDVAMRSMTEDDWRAAGHAGFSILRQGLVGLTAFLRDMWDRHRDVKVRNQRAHAVLGVLQEWLRKESEGRVRLRALLYDAVVRVLPVGPGDVVFGRPVISRRLHSIYTAHKQYEVHPTRLRKLLARVKIISADHASRSDHACVFEAAPAVPFLAKIATAMSLAEAGAYIGASPAQMKTLFDAGLIKPFIPGGEDGLGTHAFAKADLDEFLRALSAGAVTRSSAAYPIYTISDAARRANRRIDEVVSAMLDDRLRWRGRIGSSRSFGSILLDIEDVRRVLADPPVDGVPLGRLHERLSTTRAAVAFLVSSGRLGARKTTNPVNRHPLAVVAKSEVATFADKYISVRELARARGMSVGAFNAQTSAAGMAPEIYDHMSRAAFFRRCDFDWA